MRCFVAVTPSQEAVEDLDGFLEVRREAGPFRWAAPEQFHVTLAFLPEVAERHLDELEERLGRAAARRTRFVTRLASGGAFPNPARARVIWTGLELDEQRRTEIGRMATGARAAASRTGIATDGTRFTPHVTVARLGRPQEVSNWVRLLDAYTGPKWPVDALHLVQSHLGEGPRRRPRHEVLASFDLS